MSDEIESRGELASSFDADVATLGRDLVACLIEDFKKNGAEAVEKLRKDDPKTYLALIARLVPAAQAPAGHFKVATYMDLRGMAWPAT